MRRARSRCARTDFAGFAGRAVARVAGEGASGRVIDRGPEPATRITSAISGSSGFVSARTARRCCSTSSRWRTTWPTWSCAAAPRSSDDPRPRRRPPAGGRRAVQRPRRGRRASSTPSAWPAKAEELEDDLCVAMRVYFEKPRTTTGWKGMINDPGLDDSGDVNTGLADRPQAPARGAGAGPAGGLRVPRPDHPGQYISDTVAWGAIGARTTESQIHRQLGSGLSMPIGFKNRTDGNVHVAVDAVRAAAAPHAFAGVDPTGNPGDPAHQRQRGLPRDPARGARRSELRAAGHRVGAREAARRGPAASA